MTQNAILPAFSFLLRCDLVGGAAAADGVVMYLSSVIIIVVADY